MFKMKPESGSTAVSSGQIEPRRVALHSGLSLIDGKAVRRIAAAEDEDALLITMHRIVSDGCLIRIQMNT